MLVLDDAGHRLRATSSVAGGGHVRHGVDHAQAQQLRALRAEGGAVLRPRLGRAGRGRAQFELLVGARLLDVNVVRCRRRAIPTRSSRSAAGRLRPAVEDLQPHPEFLLDRAAAEHDLTRDEPRREFLRKMLGGDDSDPAARRTSSRIDWRTRRACPKKRYERRFGRRLGPGRPNCRRAWMLTGSAAGCGAGPVVGVEFPRSGYLWRPGSNLGRR